MRAIALIIGVALLLAGCAHNIYLVGRSSGATGTAKVPGGSNNGDITIVMAGKEYKGQWVYMQTGGSLGLASATAFSGTQSAAATGTFVGLPTGGNGNVIASAADGSALRCVFDYSEWSATGVGVCQDNKGETY